ncbi:MAG: GxxExxY protein [Verrucomicrobiota bacterium]
MKTNDINQLRNTVRETSFASHCYHRNTPLEKIHENALVHRLRKQGREVKQQHPLSVRDEDGTLLGEFFADLFIGNRLLVEPKAARSVAEEHIAQLLGCRRSSRIETGLLINFGSPRLPVKKHLMTDALS